MNVAVVGCGIMGSYHSRVYKNIKNVDLVAVCDIKLKSARRIGKLYKTKYYQSHLDLLRNHKIDAASIAVPTKDHLLVALDFIKRKIPILIEKPLAHSEATARKIISEAKRKKVFIMAGHIERFNPAVTKLRRMITAGEFGEILSVNVKRVGLFPTRIDDTDVLTDLAVHDLDIVTSFLNKSPDHVYARGSGALTKGRYDHAEIFLDFDKFGCFIQVNWITPIKIRQLSITGTKGYAELNYITQELSVYQTKYKIKQPSGFNEFVAEFGKPKQKKIEIVNQEPLYLEISNFVDSVNKKSKPVVTNEEALKAIILAEKVRKSVKLRKVIRT